ncbi:VOC family protein [Chitinophaga sp. Mgbs1]|uniref:Bleomycin resistance protein n=1 Tax=Chitinophaga solisilvae TaxID=1233460 RepID=A0A433WJ37_9BACT|nr:VOC family protein [Chitinophaga solisilvae]
MKFNRLIPELQVNDIAHSKLFYVEQLGFTLEYEREEDCFALISYEGAQLMLEQDSSTAWITAPLDFPRGRGINFQIEVSCLDTIIDKIEVSQLSYFEKPAEQWYRINAIEEGVKELLIQDPDGYLLRFQQYLGERKIKE